jgi:FAD/FMN-containing dehydrogenase
LTAVIERPPTEAELVAIVTRAAELRRPIRILGRPARKAPRNGEQVLVDLAAYGRALLIDPERGEATFQAGISLRHLGVTLGSWGLTMENGGRAPDQTLGAAVSLGAHGTGASQGGVATQVNALRLITPEGAIVDCSAREEPDVFNAARVGLGALGVISTVTLRVQPGFNLRARVATVDLDEALVRFESYAAGNDHFELAWLPGRDRARVITANRTEEPADGGAVDRSYRWWNRRRIWPPLIECSFGPGESAAALRRARELSAVRHLGSLFPIEVSVSAGDDIALSPAQGRPSVFIAGVAGLGGRPQWGSAHGLSPAALQAMYPKWEEWQAVRDRLDPQRRFAHSSGQG